MSEQTKALTKEGNFKGMLARMSGKLAEVLPKHVKVEHLLKAAGIAAIQNPALYACSEASIWQSMMNAAALGLEPGGPRQVAALVPYKGICQFQPMYRGLIELALRDGRIQAIEAHVVHKNDKFKCRFGSDPVLEHEPCWEGDPGDTIAAYAIARFKDGSGYVPEVMTRAELDKVQKSSKANRSDSPWAQWPDEMRRKTVIKRLCKLIPCSPQLAQAIQMDNDANGILDADYTIVDEPKSFTAGRHDAKKKPQPPPEVAQEPQEAPEQPATTKAPEQPPEQPEAPPKRKRGRPRKVQEQPEHPPAKNAQPKPEPKVTPLAGPDVEPTPEPESNPVPPEPESERLQMIEEIQDAVDEDVIPFQTVKVICNEIGIDPFEFKAASAEHIKTLHERTVGVMMKDEG